ncbi:energy-coupling factor transporter transmembrane component T family protein [Rhodococcus pyridinivorans]|uniref:energy-coupling factor transporter transmembrane component T family protein n=1 Tax=Rhodococcus pyridinivorans TaxID=103816 RepID=UPI002078BD6E|nr:energy-coupling factor transporter transmembrane protein EcfT [Rhodococcus pyridinivorans]USI91722.1 energy-coupling factor transporter transmembrane protein EcfT [Rhodococcus pyridinivorans]
MSRTRTRQRRPIILLRPVPRETPLHRVWAGTKVLSAAALSVAVSFAPSWTGLGILLSVLVVGVLVARIPRGVVPTIPWWVFAVLAVGLVLNAAGGGLAAYVRTILLGVGLLVLASLVGWTTRLSDLVDALPVLFAPLRLLRLPVDEWVTVCALALRMLPTVRAEMRVLFAARKVRGRPGIRNPAGWWQEVADSVGAVVSVSMRQVRDLGDALSVRGPRSATRRGPRSATRPPLRLRLGDVVTVLVVAGACTVITVWG